MKNHFLVLLAAFAGVYFFVKHFYGSVGGFTTSLQNGTAFSALSSASSSSLSSGSVPDMTPASIMQGSGTLAPSADYYAQNQKATYSANPAAQPNNIAAHRTLLMGRFTRAVAPARAAVSIQ